MTEKPLFPVPTGFVGHMFCALFANRYLLFTMAKVNILLVTCLAMERWYCVMRPIKYKTQFGRKRRILYILVSCIASCALQVHKIFEKKLIGNECVTVDAPYREKSSQAVIAIYSFCSFIVPCLVTWITFINIKYRMSSAMETQKSERRKTQQKMVLRLCALTAAVFTLSWFPAQVSYTLSSFGITDVTSTLHKTWNVIAFLNLCVNPLMYWYFHKEYRNEFIKLFCPCKIPRLITPSGTNTVAHNITVNHTVKPRPPQADTCL